MKVAGSVAVVVGGARGIGRACCLLLADKGAKVCCADVLEKEGQDTAVAINTKHGDGTAIFIPCDVTSDQDVNNLFSRTETEMGKMSIVIYTPAIIHEFKWQACLDVNFGGVIRVTERALQSMSKKHGGDGGVIIHTSGRAGLRPNCWGPLYCATKHAIVGYTRCWAEPENYNESGVRFNVTCPQATQTPFEDYVTAETVLHKDVHDNSKKGITIITPEFVAEGCLKLVEEETMNGQALLITAKGGHQIYQFDPNHQLS